MYEDFQKRYHFSSWAKPSAKTMSLLLRNFTPWKQDCADWVRERRKLVAEAKSLRLLRTIWGNPKEPNSRVLIETREAASAAAARKCLLEVLSQNQYARLPEGPPDLGEVCFTHPDGESPAVFMAVGNLCLSVVSFGLNPVNVADWGRRLHSRIMERPRVARLEFTLTPKKAQMKVKEEQAIRFIFPRAVSDEGYCKFFAAGAELFLMNDELHVRALRKGEVVIEGYIVEPASQPATGRAMLVVK
jgi:hypothetical protein